MKIISTDQNLLNMRTDALVLGCYKNEKFKGAVKSLDDKLKGALSVLKSDKGFTGSLGESINLNATLGKINAQRVIIVGLGPKSEFGPGVFKNAGILVGKELAGEVADISFGPEFAENKNGISKLIEGVMDGIYEFDKYKTENDKPKKSLKKIRFISKKLKEDALKIEASYARVLSESVTLVRDLVNEPPVYLTPERLSLIAENIAKTGGLECEIFGKDEIVKRGMGGLEAVSRGSSKPPRFIHLKYEPKRKPAKTIAIVGKGITFDSGGLCIKPADSMRTMKMDMAGSAVVLGVMKALPELMPTARVHGLISASENMTGSKAYKPDDVIKAYNGKTIEVINTDAEGRIVLSDALSYAVELGVDEIVDLATLTGACMVGLGSYTAGVMGNDQKLAQRVLSAAERAGEKMWQLPMDDELRDEVKSSVADIKNAGTRLGGAIIAAMFLEQFVSDTPWVHIDIAGPAFSEKKTRLKDIGATGFGVGTILELIKKR